MKYQHGYKANIKAKKQSKSSKGKPGRKIPLFWILIIVGSLITSFILWNIFFKANNEEFYTEDDNSSEELFNQEDGEDIEIIEENTSSQDFEESFLRGRNGFISGGTARRSYDGRLYRIAIVADLPPQQDQYYDYEAWMVRPGILEYFSIGRFFPREDGKYGLLYEESFPNLVDDILDYSRIIITRELKGGKEGPSSTQVAEGNF